MKTCTECSAQETSRWYAGNVCRKCYSAKRRSAVKQGNAKVGVVVHYTEEQFQEAIKLKLAGVTVLEIVIKTGVKKPSLMVLFAKRNIKLDEETKNKLIVGARWKDHQTIVEGKKKCNQCSKWILTEGFSIDKNSFDQLALACRSCHADTYAANPEPVRVRARAYRAKHLEVIREKGKLFYQNNRETYINNAKRWTLNNPQRSSELRRKNQKKHLIKRRAQVAGYRAKKKNATPKWLSKTHRDQIAEIYRMCPPDHHVDHIVPITSDVVCGLHVPWNLTYLPAHINEAKSNYFVDTQSVGTCAQFTRKLETEALDRAANMPFGCELSDLMLSEEKYSTKEHGAFIEKYEWLGKVGFPPKWTFVARHKDGHLAGVVLLGEPNKRSFKDGVECLIQRGATTAWAPKNLGSKLVMFACRSVSQNTDKKIFYGYSDSDAGEIGTIYQACNFTYLGHRFGGKGYYKAQDGRTWTKQSVTNSSAMRRWAKQLGIPWEAEWNKENGFQDRSKIPREVREKLKDHVKTILDSCEFVSVSPKGKYVLILGKDRREQKDLMDQYGGSFVAFPYPKRNTGVSSLPAPLPAHQQSLP